MRALTVRNLPSGILALALVACPWRDLLAFQETKPAQDPGPPQAISRDEKRRWEEIPILESKTPTKTPQPLRRAPSTISVIQGEDLQDLGVRFLSDALRRVPGFEVTRISSTESNVSLRGYHDDTSAAQGILALVDGRQVYNEFFGSVLWESIPVSLQDVERIEVIRGPGSFVHGPNAMHGLVNIVTKSPLQYKDGELLLSASGGSYRSNTEALTYVRRDGASGFKATLGWDDIDEFKPTGGNAKDKAFVELRHEHEFAKDHRLDVTAGLNRQRFNVLIPTFSVLPPTEFDNEVQEEFVKAAWSLGDLRVQASFAHFAASSIPQNASYSPFETLLDTADLDLQYSISPFEGHQLTAGVGYRFASFTTDHLDVSQGRHQTGLEWIFLQDEYAVAKDLWITAGIRVDHHSTTGTSPSPRLAVVWEVDEGHYLRASAGTGFRNPSLREIWFDMPVLGGLASVRGNRDLKAEQVRSFEIGYTGRPWENFGVQCNAYYNRIDRLVEFRSTTPTTLAPKNTNNEEAYGVETEVEALLADWISVFASHAFAVRQDRDTNDRNPSAPRHKANAGARLTASGGFSAMLWVTYFDDVEFSDPTGNVFLGTVDDYALLNLRVSYRFSLGDRKEALAFVQAFNAFDRDHLEHIEGDRYGLLLTAGFEVRW